MSANLADFGHDYRSVNLPCPSAYLQNSEHTHTHTIKYVKTQKHTHYNEIVNYSDAEQLITCTRRVKGLTAAHH